MRERLLSKGAETLTELEILEMLLFAGQPRGDTKPLAKSLMRQFGSLAAVLRAPVQRLAEQRGLGDASISALKLVDAASLNLAHSDIHNRPVLTSWGAVKHYCINRLAHEPIEYLIMLCLDNRNRLIAEETLSKGIFDQTPVYVHDRLIVAVAQFISLKSIDHLLYGRCRSYLPDDVTLSLAWRVNSPARRLARNRPGFAASNALPAASPAFF